MPNTEKEKIFQPWVEDKSTETAEDTNHQDRKLFQPWVEDESTDTVEDTVANDVSLLSEKNETDHDENLNAENEKQKDPSNFPSKAECSGKEQKMETKTVSSSSENTQTEKSVYEGIGCKQSTSNHSYCEKKVDGKLLETCSSPSKPSISSADKSTVYVTCIRTKTQQNSSSCSKFTLRNTDDSSKILKSSNNEIHKGTNKCDKCGKTFVSIGRLIKHVRTLACEKLQCLVCSKIFTHRNNFSVHMRTHTGQKPHQCKICNKTFTQKVHLTKHMLSHTGQQPHQCKVCNKKFSLKSNVTKHLLTHTGQKPHPCTVCDKSFSQKNHLKKHENSHTHKALLIYTDILRHSLLDVIQVETERRTQSEKNGCDEHAGKTSSNNTEN